MNIQCVQWTSKDEIFIRFRQVDSCARESIDVNVLETRASLRGKNFRVCRSVLLNNSELELLPNSDLIELKLAAHDPDYVCFFFAPCQDYDPIFY